jgi:predicted CoA-binding protein
MIEQNVVILGASEKPDRYSFKAMKLLNRLGHRTILVNPNIEVIGENRCHKDLDEVKKEFPGTIDTLTVYVNPQISEKMVDSIISLRPKRIIFNPGTENQKIFEIANKLGIRCENACTLVLLNTGQF